MIDITYPTVPAHDLDQLVRLVHPDPHSILGARPTPLGVMVRAYRPEAATVELLLESESPRPLIQSHPLGLFELLVADKFQTFPYLLRVTYPGGNQFT
ncbi:MAG: GlgB N-terminal domain-containing protein, partial [Pyrinomonadaceae bacterium]